MHRRSNTSYQHINRLSKVSRVAATSMTAAKVAAALEATAAKIKPADANPFRKGDVVVYPTHGVGRVDRVAFEDIAGHRLNLCACPWPRRAPLGCESSPPGRFWPQLWPR